MMNCKGCGLLVILATALSGCQSFSTTMLNRRGDNSLQGNSNGVAKLFHKTRPYKGIPITLKVPSHLDVSIKEVYYVGIKGDRVESLLPNTRLLNVDTEIIKTDKVFTVDFKRPGAGSLDLDLAFNKDQYFSQIVSKLDDSTIEEAGKLAAQLIRSTRQFAKTSREPNATEIDALALKGIYREQRTVAYQRFDINDGDFETQVEMFVNHHLNACNDCGHSPLYDRVASDLPADAPQQVIWDSGPAD